MVRRHHLYRSPVLHMLPYLPTILLSLLNLLHLQASEIDLSSPSATDTIGSKAVVCTPASLAHLFGLQYQHVRRFGHAVQLLLATGDTISWLVGAPGQDQDEGVFYQIDVRYSKDMARAWLLTGSHKLIRDAL